jgi:hypothetical protein
MLPLVAAGDVPWLAPEYAELLELLPYALPV